MSKAVLNELAKRVNAAKLKAETPRLTIQERLFQKQIEFVKDPATRKTAVCSRRSGKSEACGDDLVDTAYNEPNVNVAYITLTRVSAKKIIWRIIKRIIKERGLVPKRIDDTELSVEFDNGSMIYVSGAKDAGEIEKFRGMSLRKIYIDECQSFRSHIKELIDDVLDPATWDVDGTICLLGTPGPVPAGFFYDITHSEGWSNHAWTIFDNPFIELKSKKKPQEILEQTLARRGVGVSDPSVQREFFGAWTADTNSLVFRFDKNRNTILTIPQDLTYVFGIDLGYNDADAIAVLGYSSKEGKIYLVEEFVKNKLGVEALIDEVKRLQKKYNPVKMVMDAGALGKKIQEDIQKRHGIPVEAADKHRKLEYIELLNDDLRTGRFQTTSGTRFEQDCNLVQWDRDNPEKPKISDSYHSDITDAVLYAWRMGFHYLPHTEVPNHARDSQAYMDALEEKEAEAMELKMAGMDEEWGVEDADLDDIHD